MTTLYQIDSQGLATGVVREYTGVSLPSGWVTEPPPDSAAAMYVGGQWVALDAPPSVPAYPMTAPDYAAAVAKIKGEAAALLSSLEWRLQRAQERVKTDPKEANVEQLYAELMARERVRLASDAAEAAVLQLSEAGEVASFSWSPEDVPMPAPAPIITRFAFVSRFSETEAEHPACKAAMATLTIVSFVDLRLAGPLLAQLVAAEGITSSRAAVIGSTTVSAKERIL